MKKLILTVALVLSLADTAFAESWLCIDEAEAGVSTTAPFTSSEITPGDDKYLVTVNEDTNQVEFKYFGGAAMDVDCNNYPSSIACVSPSGSMGFEFSLDKKTYSFWHYSLIKADLDGRMWITVEAGKCSTI